MDNYFKLDILKTVLNYTPIEKAVETTKTIIEELFKDEED